MNSQGGRRLAIADAFGLGARRNGDFSRPGAAEAAVRFDFGAAFNLAGNIADDSAEPAVPQAQLAMMALELFGMDRATCLS